MFLPRALSSISDAQSAVQRISPVSVSSSGTEGLNLSTTAALRSEDDRIEIRYQG